MACFMEIGRAFEGRTLYSIRYSYATFAKPGDNIPKLHRLFTGNKDGALSEDAPVEIMFQLEKGLLADLNHVYGMTLLEFQLYLESVGGSLMVPITQSKDSYVYIQGQKDYSGREIG